MNGTEATTLVETIELFKKRAGGQQILGDVLATLSPTPLDIAQRMRVHAELVTALWDLAEMTETDPLLNFARGGVVRVRDAFTSGSVVNSASGIAKELNQETLPSLHAVASMLAAREGRSEPQSDHELLEHVRDVAEALIDEIDDDEQLDGDVKDVLRDLLVAVVLAATQARFGGRSPLVEVGAQGVVRVAAETELPDHPLVRRATSFLSALALLWTPVAITADTAAVIAMIDNAKPIECVVRPLTEQQALPAPPTPKELAPPTSEK